MKIPNVYKFLISSAVPISRWKDPDPSFRRIHKLFANCPTTVKSKKNLIPMVVLLAWYRFQSQPSHPFQDKARPLSGRIRVAWVSIGGSPPGRARRTPRGRGWGPNDKNVLYTSQSLAALPNVSRFMAFRAIRKGAQDKQPISCFCDFFHFFWRR